MKKYIIFLLLITSISAKAQTYFANPIGNIISVCPGTTITQSSPATVFFQETIPANTFTTGRWYAMEMHFKLTTPALSIPGISVTFQFGTSTYNCMSSAALLGGQSGQYFRIRFRMVAAGANSQIPVAELIQPNGSLVTLTTSNSNAVGSFAANSAIANVFSVTIQFTGVGLGTSSLNNFWTFRDAF